MTPPMRWTAANPRTHLPGHWSGQDLPACGLRPPHPRYVQEPTDAPTCARCRWHLAREDPLFMARLAGAGWPLPDDRPRDR